MDKYCIDTQFKNAIHDNAVLGFQAEHIGPKNLVDETDSEIYENEVHMMNVFRCYIKQVLS